MWMVLNAGWLFRIGLTQWIFTGQWTGGSFVSVTSLVDYILPLVVLELYLYESSPLQQLRPAGRRPD